MSAKTEDYDSIKKRIRGLLSKTALNGATEAEAMAASTKARELMDKYQVEEGDLRIVEEGFLTAELQATALEGKFMWRVMYAIDLYCDVKSYRNRMRGCKPTYKVVGLRSDVELATWLMESLASYAVSGSYDHVRPMMTHWASDTERKRMSWQHRVAFVEGCAMKLAKRLKDMAAARYQAAASGSRALVPIDKRKLIDAHLEQQGIRLKTSSVKTLDRHHDSLWAGAKHADGAGLGRPVEGGAAPVARIGRS
jgi:Protein of unknown function (DUF2786)